MLIPSIDLQGGRIVQLVQGERLALETHDIDAWIQRLTGQPKVQLIDLDAAKGVGGNGELVARICRALPCRVGGGIRSVARAQEVLELGARSVILGSALFTERGVDVNIAAQFSEAVGASQLIAAVDTRGGKIVIHGWRTQVPYGPIEAIHALDPYVGEFLFTNVDREGLMQGTDMDAIAEIRRATARAVTAAGGITTMEEVAALDAIGVDSVVGMALYTGRIVLGGRR